MSTSTSQMGKMQGNVESMQSGSSMNPKESSIKQSQLSSSQPLQQQQEHMQQHEQRQYQTHQQRPQQRQPKRRSQRKLESGKNLSVGEPTIDFFNELVATNTHTFIGRSGVKVNRICLGSMNFGEIDKKFGTRPGQLSEEKACQILDKYVELGGNCIDTANFFPWFGSNIGESETIIGNWLNQAKCDREDIVLITKLRLPTDPQDINSGGLSRMNIINSVEESLERLQTDYIDLLMLNGWDDTVDIFETVRDLDELVKQNKIRYYGVCDFKGWQLQKIIDVAKINNLHKCVCYMGEYNLLTRGCEVEVLEVCRNEKVGFFGYSPFKYGVLTDDFAKNLDKPLEGSRVEAASKHEHPNLAAMAVPFEEIKQNPVFKNVLNVCQSIAKNKNFSIEVVSLLWALQSGHVTSVVVGVEDLEELEECMNCLTEQKFLTFNEIQQLNEASSMKLQYPYNTNLSTFAGLQYILPSLKSSFEQLSLRLPPSTLFYNYLNLPLFTFEDSSKLNFPEKWLKQMVPPQSGEQMQSQSQHIRS